MALGALMPALASANAGALNVWWPTNGAHVSGTQPFKAQLSGLDVSQYQMFWQVDGGQLNAMSDNATDYPHKEASVDLSGWNWHGSGPYTVNFVAKDQSGNVIAQQAESIYVGQNSAPQVAVSAPVTTLSGDADPAHVAQEQTLITAVESGQDTDPVHVAQANTYLSQSQTQSQTQTQTQNTNTSQTQTQSQSQTQALSVNVSAPTVSLSNTSGLYVNPNSEAAAQAKVWAGNAQESSAMQLLASEPTAQWFGNWDGNVEQDVSTLVAAAVSQNKVPVLVSYNIPERDCGGFSSGGSNNPAGYTSWIQQFAQGLGQNKAVVILEPDSLAQISCLSSADQQTRLNLLFAAVKTIKQDSNAKVYLDAGHANWIDANTMAGDLKAAGVSSADGFALNVSNFDTTSQEVSYGTQISQALNGEHFIVDTSRNGNGSNGEWCNPSGRAIGETPTMSTGNSLVDAFLWVKTPGESDGNCNGGPSAGVWWPEYALQLVLNAQ